MQRDAALKALDGGATDLTGAQLQGVDLSGRDLRGVDFTRAQFQGADLSGADLTGARLEDTDLRGANLARATLVDAYIGARAERADMTGVDMSGATITFAFLADVNNARLELAGATMPDGTEYQHPSTGAMSYGLAQAIEQGRREQAAEAAAALIQTPPISAVTAIGSASTSSRPKNAILGWFVVATLILAFLDNVIGYSFYEQPLVPTAAAVLAAGLVISRLRKGAFGRVWLLVTGIVSLFLFFGAVGISQGSAGAEQAGGGFQMVVPGILAIIARIRARAS